MTNPAAAVLGVFDLAFVVTYAYPLLIVVLVYNVVSADRESGTLALAASQPIAFRRWLAARVAVRALLIVVCGVLLPTAGAVLTIADWSTESLMPIGLWTAAVLGYSMFWLACVVAVSLTMASSALSAIVSVSAWLVVVIAVPAVIELAAPLLNPASTRLSYATHERGASLEMNSRVDAAIAALNQLSRTQFEAFAENDGDHPTFTEPVDAPVESNLLEALPHPPWSSRMPVVQLARGFGEARRIVVEEKLAPVLRELVAAEVREASFIAYTRFLSPALLFQAIADDVTGTGQERWKRFLAQVDDYVREQDSFFTRKILANQNVTSQELATLAPFHFQEEESSAIVSRVAVPLSTLLIMAVGMWMLCIRWSRHWPE
jgi:ABC-2 type transport system permease protein